MAKNKSVATPRIQSIQVKPSTIRDKISDPPKLEDLNLVIDFSSFKLDPICLSGKFNNHFKDTDHFASIASYFLKNILPKITSHSYKDICEGGVEGRELHFHTIDDSHKELVREVLEKYSFPDSKIEQMFEGNSIFEFSAILGHTYAARVICHKVDNILQLLFIDTNHHIYFNPKYTKESLFYENCPIYAQGSCNYMPFDCYAVSYLDEKKVAESFGYTTTP